MGGGAARGLSQKLEEGVGQAEEGKEEDEDEEGGEEETKSDSTCRQFADWSRARPVCFSWCVCVCVCV